MDLTNEQMTYIRKHLRNYDKTLSIAVIARKLAQNNLDAHLEPDEVEKAALLMNIGETSEDMEINGENIYDHAGAWTQEMIDLNKIRGEKSVKMAESQGIILSDTAKEAIISTSRGGTLNKMGITLKVAQTMEAIKHSRWSRGQQKQPAKDITEVTEILNEELSFMLRGQELSDDVKKQIQNSMIISARTTYVQGKKVNIRNLIESVAVQAEQDTKAMGREDYTTILNETGIEEIIDSLTEQDVDEFGSNVERITSEEQYTPIRKEVAIFNFINNWRNREFDDRKDVPEDIV